MELTDLSELARSTQRRYQECFNPMDCHLPHDFKEHFKKFNYNDNIEYFDYSLVVHSSSSLNIFIPNQWIYIAYYFVEYYRMIKAYREKALSQLSKDEIKGCANNEGKARSLLTNYHGTDKEFLIRFLSDYSWWGGGKTLDRNDYYVSPILSLAGLVNASQSYVADICKNLAESNTAYEILDAKILDNQGTDMPGDAPKSLLKDFLGIFGNKQKIDYLAAVRTKPFMLLAGISGTGKSRIVRKLAQATVPKNLQEAYDGIQGRSSEAFKEERWTLHRPANFELIQVKPNWHNSMDVVGYLSNIPSPHYVFTPFINFIVRAMCHPEVPFFLCLDEMNLAPVEEYFAEFLSAIESRAKTKEGKYMTDHIIPPFKTYGEVKDPAGNKANVGDDMLDAIREMIKNETSDQRKNDVIDHLREKGVTLPENLIIIGTVNMDETTFSFSRKVLDRAMSMEMNKVDYSSFLTGNTDDDIKAIADHYKVDEDSTGEVNELNKLLVDRHIEAKEVVPALQEEARFVIDYLETINKLLDGTPFKLGYRAANEALIYLQSTKDFGMNDKEAAMDRFTLMKILSRIEGDESKLKLTESDKSRVEACGIDFGKLSEYPSGATILSAMREIIADKLAPQAEAPRPPEGGDTDETQAPRPPKGGDTDETQAPQPPKGGEEDSEAPQPPKGGEPAPRESIKKLDAMMAQLDRDHFVSYWS